MNYKDPERRARALAAKLFCMEALTGRELTVKTYLTRAGKERQTFGRYVADVYAVGDGMGLPDIDLASALRDNNLLKRDDPPTPLAA